MKRVLTVGAGPAGLYASLLLKAARPNLEVTVVERNPRGATYGWGVVFSDRTLAEFREADPATSEAITDRFVLWDAIDIRYRDEVIRSGGHVFAGIARVALLEILAARCEELGVEVRFDEELEPDPSVLDGYDLVVAADGVNSRIRERFEKAFGPSVEHGVSRYIWFGTRRVFDSFTFIFRESEQGLFQVHAYPFDGETGTFIVETHEDTWRRIGLDLADEAASIAFCERLFAEDLDGRSLMSNRSQWIAFPTVRSHAWRHGHVALVGDAAHTAHFSIGSGTKLAMEDAIALARAVAEHEEDVEGALAAYESERRPVVERFQEAAAESRTYFESTRRYLHLEPMPFAFHLLTRSGRIDYPTLRLRDPRYADAVDRSFAGRGLGSPPPLHVPMRLGPLELGHRAASATGPLDDGRDGSLGPGDAEALARAAARGAALVVTDVVAMEPEGRITPGTPGLWSEDHAESWRRAIGEAHAAGSAVALRLGHAGRRAGTRPRREGLDLPLDRGWPLVAASPIPYTSRSPVPEEATAADLIRVVEAFASAARRAASSGADLVLVDMAQGYLLHGFLSPLANVRGDRYGGSHEARTRFPVEVFEAVRASWPEDRPLGATIPATDLVDEGWTVEDAVALARALRDRCCDLVEPRAGFAVPSFRPRYRRGFLVPHADRIRNEARLAVLVGGAIPTTDVANTILAAGRADVCVLD